MSRGPSIVRRAWFVPALAGGIVAVVFVQGLLLDTSPAEVERELRQKYGVSEIGWEDNGRYQRDTWVIDGDTAFAPVER